MKPLDGETIGAVSTEAGLYLLFDRDWGNIVSIGQSETVRNDSEAMR